MSDIASLGLKVDSTDATRAATNLDKLTTAGGRSEEAAKRVQRSWEQAVQRTAAEMNALNGRVDVLNGTQSKMLAAVERVASQMDRMAASYERSSRAADNAARAYGAVGREAGASVGGVDRMNRSITQTETSAAAAGASIRRYLLTALGSLSVFRLIDTADQWGEYSERIRMATRSAEEYQVVQDRMASSAQRTYRHINETKESFIQLSPTLRSMGLNLEQSIDAVDTFSGLLVVNAASSDRAQNAMRALSVATQKGKVDVDAWMSIATTMPSIIGLIADSTGRTEKEIRTLGTSGVLSIEMLVKALVDGYLPTMEKVDGMRTTFRDAVRNLSTDFGELIGKTNEANDVTGTLVDGIELVSKNLETVLTVALAAGAAGLARYTLGMGAAITAATAKSVQAGIAAASELRLAQAQVTQTTASLVQARALGTVTANMAQQTAAANALAAAELRLAAAKAGVAAAGGTLLGVLTGPAGIAITAGLAAAAFMTMGNSAQAAASEIDVLGGSLKELTENQLLAGQSTLTAAIEDASSEMVKARANVDAIAERLVHAEGAWLRSETAVQLLKDELIQAQGAADTAGQKFERLVARSSEITKALYDLRHGADAAAGGIRALKDAMSFTEAGEKYLAQIQGRIKALQDGGDPVKMATRWLNDHAEASEADKIAIMSAAQAEKALQEMRDRAAKAAEASTRAINDAKKAAEAFEKSRRQYIDGLYDEISSLDEQARGLTQQIQLFGRAESAVYDYTIAQLEQEKAALAIVDADNEQVKILERKIALYQQMKSSAITLEGLEADKRAWEQWSRDVEQIFDQVGQSLTDAIFDGGKSGRELVKDLFKTLTLRVLVQPVMGALQGQMTQQLGGMFGYQNPQQGNILSYGQSLNSAYQAANGGLSSTFGNAAQWLGRQVGSEALSAFGMGMSGAGGIAAIGTGLGASLGTTIGTSAAAMTTTTFSAALGGGAGAAAGSGIIGGVAGGGAAGLGAALSAALPWVGGALAIGSAFGLFDDGPPKTRHGQRARVDFSGGAYGVTSTDDRQPGAENAIRQMAQQAVDAANALIRQTGVDAAIEAFYAITESSVLGDRQGVASGGTLRIGDQMRQIGIAGASDMTKYGFGGWTEAEMLPRLQTDIQLSLLEAFQALGDQLPDVLYDMIAGVDIRGLGAEDAAGLTQRFAAVVDGVSQFMAAVEAMPFEQLKDLSFDAAAGLVQLSGGVESLVAAHEAYYQAIYTEAERLEQQRQDVERSLGKLNMTMPQTQEQYRSLVESLDLNTEAGREAYTTLISLAPAWSAVNEQMARAAQEASSAALAVSKLADGSIDMQVLATQLADATESTFVRTMVSVFDSLADRLSNIIDGIGSERGAAQAAIRQISDLGTMTPAQIMREIRGINTALPSNSGVVAAASRLNAADSLAARLKAQESALRNQYLPAQTQREGAVERFNLAQEALSEAQARVEKLEWDIYAPKTVPYKEGNWHELNAAREAAQPLIGGAREELSRARREAQAAQAALNASPGQSTVEHLAAQYAAAVSASAKAQAQAAAAAQEAKRSQTAYADAMQGFAIDAGKSVSKLASLREETLRYYEAQAALANLMTTSAEGLRKTVLDYRVSQLNPDDQFTYLQSEFEKVYSMALSTDGEVLAGYADKLSSMLNPLIEQANNTFGSQASLDSFIATTLARAQKIAGRVEALTPTDYAADSLGVLTQIDATLAALEASTRSAEQIMVDAINAGRDATVNGLRQVVNALTGKSVAAFATGGYHTGGLRLVGEHGPELEATGPARIYSADRTRAMLSGGNQDLLIEVRALRQSNEALRSEVAGLRIEARATAVSTHKIAKQGDRNEVDGVKVRTDADEPLHVEVI